MTTNNAVTTAKANLVLDKKVIVEEGLIYESIYKQLLFVNEHNVLNGSLNDSNAFRYDIEFLAKKFKITFSDTFNTLVRLQEQHLISFYYELDLEKDTSLKLYIKINPSK